MGLSVHTCTNRVVDEIFQGKYIASEEKKRGREREGLGPDSQDINTQEKSEEWEATKETRGEHLTGRRKTKNMGSQNAKGKKLFKRKGMVNINFCFRGHIKEAGLGFVFFFFKKPFGLTAFVTLIGINWSRIAVVEWEVRKWGK